jgi:hypothetical protein
MKIILSRKGFDSAYGGYPSPILPGGRLISLPIPDNDIVKYSDLKLNDKQTYFDLMKQLNQKIKYGTKWHELTKDTECHLDPDIYSDVVTRDKAWCSLFGQIKAAQGHLSKQKVGVGDLFLFFGWFKQTIWENEKLCFKKSAPDLHVIFGYLQIGKIINSEKDISTWMKYHPHCKAERWCVKNNAIYVARDTLTWDNKIPGAGVFKFSKELVLTKEGFTRSNWDLPDFFKKVKMSKHRQEKVIEDNDDVENWAKKLINIGLKK